MSADVTPQPCPRCQALPAPGDVFCRECGLSLNDDEAARATVSLGNLSLSDNAAPRPSVSEFFAGPETSANLSDWSAPAASSFIGFSPAAETPTAPLKVVRLRRRRRKIALLVLAVVLVMLGTGGGVAYLLTRTNPVIQITSDYTMGATLVGAPGTSFHISGQQFFANSSITFLLDGQPAPGDQTVQSDSKGSFQVALPITAQWQVGRHLLTARDALGNTAGSGVPVQIFAPGQGGTPGPNGAPSDSDSFSLDIQVTAMNSAGNTRNFSQTLTIINNPNAAGSTCDTANTGKTVVFTGNLEVTNVSYTEKIVFACQATYQQGRLNYVETATSDTFALGDGRTCASPAPYIFEAFEGVFSSSISINGTYYRDYFQANCNDKSYIYRDSETGTWSGSL